MRVIAVLAILVILAVGIDAVQTAVGRKGKESVKAQKKGAAAKKKDICKGPNVEDTVAQIVGTTNDWKAAKEKRTDQWVRAPTSNLAAGYGIILGEKKQTLFWDVKEKVWRYGPGSFDPASGVSRENLKCPFSKVVAKPGPAVDMCKINPSLCAGKGAFCSKDEHKKYCCADGGCKGAAANAVRGLSRSKMPQAQDSPTVESSKWFAYHKSLAKDFACPEADVTLDDLTPIQDEINLGKSLVIACGIRAGDRPKFIITEDLFIYDGHHRWSSYKAANQYLGTKITTIKVHKCNKKAAWMIAEAHKLMLPEAKDGSKKPNAIKFEGLLEIRARYGPRVHEDEDAARETYVIHTMQRMDKAGFVPRDGVESLREFWENNVRKHAGW